MIPLTLVMLVGLLALSIPVAASMGILGLVLSDLYAFIPLTSAVGEIAWSTSTQFILLAIPLYVFMGELLMRSGVAENMYGAMAKWLSWLPGGLMHSNIGFCAAFSATSGTSVATAATVGTVAIDQVDRRGYNRPLFLGTLAAGGTLGILIPPSTNMILYGILTDTSIPKLYLAGFLPGILLALGFMAAIAGLCQLRPAWAGTPVGYSWQERFDALPDLLPPLGLFIVVIGSIYAGWATPTESAALGVLATTALAWRRGRLGIDVVLAALLGAMRTTAMCMAILLGAYFLNFVWGSIGLTAAINDLIQGLGLSKYALLALVVLFYFILGMFMDTLTMMVATIPIIVPTMSAAGFDPVWFGIVMILLIEMAMITPPMGINLFVIKSVTRTASLDQIMVGVVPFIVVMLLMVLLITVFPGVVMFVPDLFSR